jgi:hypothetical protein
MTDLQQALRQGVREITGDFLLILSELVDSDCAREIARCMLRLAMMRYWHFKMITMASVFRGYASLDYTTHLLSGRVIIPKMTIMFGFRWQMCEFLEEVFCSGLLRHGTTQSTYYGLTGRLKGYLGDFIDFELVVGHMEEILSNLTMTFDPFLLTYYIDGKRYEKKFLTI